jgi:hypothetical protein
MTWGVSASTPKPLPIVVEVVPDVIVREPGGALISVTLHESILGWTLMAVMEVPDDGPIAVFEDLGTPTGPLAYVSATGPIMVLPKTLESTAAPSGPVYRGHPIDEVLPPAPDILRQEYLADPDEPSYETVSPSVPPIRRVRIGGLEAPHAFVGSRPCADVVPVYYDPRRATPRVNPVVVAPEIASVLDREAVEEGLVGGWLPVVRMAYPVADDVRWDSLVFGEPEPPHPFIQPAWYRFLRIEGGRVTEAHYFRSYRPYPGSAEPHPGAFYAALHVVHRYWSDALSGVATVDLPEPWIGDFCRHAMVQEMITRTGDHPRYGVVDRAYGAPEHDGFQDVLTSAVTCYQEWGLLDVADRYLRGYLRDFVHEDGSLEYRGPEIGQYGRMLTILARQYDLTGDEGILLEEAGKIEAIVGLLGERRGIGLARPASDPAHGLLPGRHEADISFDTVTLGTEDYEQPYFSNSTEAWRGFRDLGRAWQALGHRRADGGLVERGSWLVEEAAALRSDIDRALRRSRIEDEGELALPAIAGAAMLPHEAPYRSAPASFDENRVWSEMFASGVVPQDIVEIILRCAARHGGTSFGIVTNRTLVVGFHAAGQAWGLIQHDRIRELLLLYYAVAAHLHTRGTWTALECVDLDRDRAAHLPYCAPAQLTVPLITRWMLVFEEPLSDMLWLARASPRRWLAQGGRIGVRDMPTRWGRVTYELRSRLDELTIDASVTLPSGLPEGSRLRLRVPGRLAIASVSLDGVPWPAFNGDEEAIRLPAGTGRELLLIVRFHSSR